MSMHHRFRPSTTRRLALTLGASLLALAPLSRLAAQDAAGYELAIVDSRGKKEVVGKLPAGTIAPRISPDGDRFAVGLAESAGAPTRIALIDIEDLAKRTLLPAAGAGANVPGGWSPDAKQLVFSAAGNGADVLPGIFVQATTGKGAAERLVDGVAAEGFTPDGKQVVYLTRTAEADLGAQSFDLAARTSAKLVDLPKSGQAGAVISPDGKWVAYATNDTGEWDVWLERLPVGGKRFRVTSGGGQYPLWTPDGYQLYYTQKGQIHRVFLFLDKENPQLGELEKLPITGFAQDDLHRPYDLMPDGLRLLMLFPAK